MKAAKLVGIVIVFTTLFVQSIQLNATNYTENNAITFVENGITFSVFQNGEFDFYLNSQTRYMGPSASISFNSGYNYNAFVQFDYYGAVVQVERTPIFYDNYGRISQVGRINIGYHHGRLYNIGNLFVHYDAFGQYMYHSGYINNFNRYYQYPPHYNTFVRPYAGYRVVRLNPYRSHYDPTRYQYYTDYRYAYQHHNDYQYRYSKKRAMHKQYGARNATLTADYRYARNSNSKSKNTYSKKAVAYSTDSKNTNWEQSDSQKRLNSRNSKTADRNHNSRSNSQSFRVSPNQSNQKANAHKYAHKKRNVKQQSKRHS